MMDFIEKQYLKEVTYALLWSTLLTLEASCGRMVFLYRTKTHGFLWSLLPSIPMCPLLWSAASEDACPPFLSSLYAQTPLTSRGRSSPYLAFRLVWPSWTIVTSVASKKKTGSFHFLPEATTPVRKPKLTTWRGHLEELQGSRPS